MRRACPRPIIVLTPLPFSPGASMTREEFRRAYRAARWTLKNRPFADLDVALPSCPRLRGKVLAVLVMAGQLQLPTFGGMQLALLPIYA